MAYTVRELSGWGVYDNEERLVSTHESEIEAKASAFRKRHVVVQAPPATPEVYPVTATP